MTGVPLAVCATPIGNLADVSQRLLAELERADVVACEDTRRTRVLCAGHGIQARLVSLHEHNEAERVPGLIARLQAGERVVLVSDAGMPAVSDPGARLVTAALAAGLEVTVLPGPSAVTAAVAGSGLGGEGFVFCGFLPRSGAALDALLDRLDACGLPLVAFESPHRLPATLRRLAARHPDRQATVCRELSKLHEQIRRASLTELAQDFAESPKGEVTLVLAAAPAVSPGPVDDAALADLARAVGARQASELAARLTGVSRNQLYRQLTVRR